KGGDLLLAAMRELLRTQAVQCVVLGSGDTYFEQAFNALQAEFPDKMRVWIGYNESLAHRIEAAADIFVMPSRYEPCGLNQIYSLRYGTLPVVRYTGGLADTVVDASPEAIERQTATGFVFYNAEPQALLSSLQRALACYADKKLWAQMQKAAMARDFSWERSAQHYLSLYQRCMFS
ncbi:MAG TPA: glycosyltransferase, partial [Pseudomonadales bacterium]|nr:glycosyltransferase [Pseudomonadales bacterium]